METLMAMPPVLAAVVGLLLLAWVVLLILIPFMVEGIRTWTRKNHEELRALNQKFERLTAELEARREAIPRPTVPRTAARTAGSNSAPAHPTPARREPTLSELPGDTGQDHRPRR
jgi:type II secretory pathway component PulM